MAIVNIIIRLVCGAVVGCVLMLASASVYASDAQQGENGAMVNNIVPTGAWVLPKIYGNVKSRYSIKYPDGWKADKTELGILVIKGKENTPSYQSAVNIQAINTKENGGQFESVSEFIYSIKYQVAKNSLARNFSMTVILS